MYSPLKCACAVLRSRSLRSDLATHRFARRDVLIKTNLLVYYIYYFIYKDKKEMKERKKKRKKENERLSFSYLSHLIFVIVYSTDMSFLTIRFSKGLKMKNK